MGETNKTYQELYETVFWSSRMLGVGMEQDQILGAIRTLKTKVRQMERKLAEYEPVLPTEGGLAEAAKEGEEVEEAGEGLPELPEAEG